DRPNLPAAPPEPDGWSPDTDGWITLPRVRGRAGEGAAEAVPSGCPRPHRSHRSHGCPCNLPPTPPGFGVWSSVSRQAPASTMSDTNWKPETIAVHGGYRPDPTTRAVAVPIYQTVAYAFDSTQHGADLFDLKVPGNIYTRIMNPTTDVLEQRVAALEGRVGALALASRQAAITYALQPLSEADDNFVSPAALDGGTYTLFAHTLPQFGIETRFADHRDPESFGKLIDERTKAVFVESIGNPLG